MVYLIISTLKFVWCPHCPAQATGQADLLEHCGRQYSMQRLWTFVIIVIIVHYCSF